MDGVWLGGRVAKSEEEVVGCGESKLGNRRDWARGRVAKFEEEIEGLKTLKKFEV